MTKQYEVVLLAGPETMPFDVDADSHCIEKPDVKTGTSSYSNESPLFIVFYRNAPSPATTAGELAELHREPVDGHPIAAGLAKAAPGIEVFRAPLHQLLAVRLVDDEDEDE